MSPGPVRLLALLCFAFLVVAAAGEPCLDRFLSAFVPNGCGLLAELAGTDSGTEFFLHLRQIGLRFGPALILLAAACLSGAACFLERTEHGPGLFTAQFSGLDRRLEPFAHSVIVGILGVGHAKGQKAHGKEQDEGVQPTWRLADRI